jgi:hypothetical protein
MFSDDLFVKAGGEFPYRRYQEGTCLNISKLRHLLIEYEPRYDPSGFEVSKLERKVFSKNPTEPPVYTLFEPGPKNIVPDNSWELNVVIDQYTETSRMNSPGYGKELSPLELWSGFTFSQRRDEILKGKKSLHDAREAIYKEGEVRLAYVTDSIGLYSYIRSEFLSKISQPTVVDITAFGDRLVAAAHSGYSYIGVDPDPTLVDGISRLTLDVQTILPQAKISTFTLPLEHLTVSHEVDLVTFSPPPYTAEPYNGGERQVHKVYRSFSHWFFGFVREALVRAKMWLREGGILGFSVLDRETTPKITYTEAMIYLAMKLGFRPTKIFTLSSSAGTPWWIFTKDSSFTDDRFDKIYKDLFPKNLSKNISPGMEYLRHLASGYLLKTVTEAQLFDKVGKEKEILGRILMSKVPTEYDLDPVFPNAESEFILREEDFNMQPRLPIVVQTADAGFRDQIPFDASIKPSRQTAMSSFVGLLNIITAYLQWIQCTYEFENLERRVRLTREKNGAFELALEKRFSMNVISFLRKHTLFAPEELTKIRVFPTKVVLWSLPFSGTDAGHQAIASGLSLFRYETVGLIAHHYTRPESRIEAIRKITRFMGNKDGGDVVDLFATPFNANTSLYASPYPDVDPGSLGNFFSYDGGDHKILMANPPPYKGFDEKMIERLIKVYLDPMRFPDRVIFYSTTVWEDTGRPYLDRIMENKNPEFEDFDDNDVLKMMWAIPEYRQYVRAVYILDHKKHPTFDPYTKRTIPKTRPTQSVGVILSQTDQSLDLEKLSLLSSDAHFVF